MATPTTLTDYGAAEGTAPAFERGDVVQEADPEEDDPDAMVVVALPDEPAGEYELDPLAGTTICDHTSTPESVSENESVFEVVFVETLLYYEGNLPRPCTPTTAHEHFEAIEESPVTVYAYPRSRLTDN